VSYINVDAIQVPFGESFTYSPSEKPFYSFTDGEELMAAARIINLLDGLDNGEYVIVSKDIF
jgi:hypothetical protein